MTKLKTMKSVYCYFFPETRGLLHKVESIMLPDEMWLVTTPTEKVRKYLESLFDQPPLDIPSTDEGYIDLDTIHVPIIERIVAAYSSYVPSLGNFEYSYPTSGSSEGIFHILAKCRTDGSESINVLNGEYEGYSAYAGHLGMKVNIINPDKTDLNKIKPGVWFISNPSARDGNIIPNDFINGICNANHKVILDLAYVGATKPYEFDVSHKNITKVVMSFSKSYGVFRFRIGGFAFSREEIPSLYGNKWFKDTERLLQALKLAEEIGPGGLYDKYRTIQLGIIDDINKEFGLGLRASDSFLLAYLKDEDTKKLSEEQISMIKEFKRGDTYRFCLTPYFEMKERQGRYKTK